MSSLFSGLYSGIVVGKHVTCLVRPFSKSHPPQCVLAEPMPDHSEFVSPEPIQENWGSCAQVSSAVPILSDDGK